jgi:tetratricopeptide (TPR) repeat protein
MKLRALLLGLLLGGLLSFSRAPAGLDAASLASAGAADSALFRAAALLLCALVFSPLCRVFAAGVGAASLLCGAALGFAAHALAWSAAPTPASTAGWIAGLGLCALLVCAIGRTSPVSTAQTSPATAHGSTLGWLLCGLGVATALEATARPLRLMGGARVADESVFAALFLAWIALGALAFAPLLGRRAWGPLLGAVLLSLAALSCLEALGFLAGISDRSGLERFAGRYGLGLSDHGGLGFDALLGARCFALPGLAAGVGLAALGARAPWSALLSGAAIAALLFPSLVSATLADLPTGSVAESLRELARQPALRAALGASCCGIGAAFVLAGSRSVGVAVRAVGCVSVLLFALAPWVVSRPAVLPISPWLRFAVAPEFVRELPEGLLTVEPAPGPSLVVCLDRRRLTPLSSEQAAEDAQMHASLALVSTPAPRVLLNGPLTAARWTLLRGRGVQTVHRVWAGAAFGREIENLLVGELPALAGESALPEECLRLSRASDVLIAPAVEGGNPAGLARALGELDIPAVAWLRAIDGAAEREWGDNVFLTLGRLQDLAVGVTQEGSSARAPALSAFRAGSRVSLGAPWARLRMRLQEREFHSLRACGERLARASRGTPQAAWTSALEELLDAQVRSSPYETPAQSVELPAEALGRLSEAAMAPRAELASFERALLEFIARTLAEKRELESLLVDFAPIAERFAPWPALERALARADWEIFDYESAAQRLELARTEWPYDLKLGTWHAEALLRAGRAAEAVKAWESLLRIQPNRREFLRWRAIALARAGDPLARAALLAELSVRPDDPLLSSHLDPSGPLAVLPAPVAGILPGEVAENDPDEH